MPEQAGFYDDPMVYDILHGPGTADDVTLLERVADRFAPARLARAWLEPACGSGRYLRVAAQRGTRVVGFDISPAMIAFARRRLAAIDVLHRATLFVAPMEDFVGEACPPGSLGLAFNLINSFRHLMTDAAATAHLRQVREALAPGGVYVVGLSTTVYGVEQPSEDVWTGGRGRRRVTQVVQYEPPIGPRGGTRVERVVSHITVTTPRGERHVDSRYALRTYSLAQWTALLEQAGWGVEATLDGVGGASRPADMGYRLYVLTAR